jgi:GGDEF domain-containing protein
MSAGIGAAVRSPADAMVVPCRVRPIAAFLRWLGASIGGGRDLRTVRAAGSRQALAAARDAMARRTPRIAMAMVTLADLPEVQMLFGKRAARKVIGAAHARLRKVAGRRGFVCRSGPASFAVLVPGFSDETGSAPLRAALVRATSIEMEVAGEEIVVLASFAITELESATPMEQACRELSRRIVGEAQQRLQLQRRATRKRRSAAADPAATSASSVAYAPTAPATLPATVPATLPATLPMPLR